MATPLDLPLDSSTLVATFYRFVHLPDVALWRDRLGALGQGLGLKGTILLATEGLNATIAGDPLAVDTLITVLGEDPRFAGLTYRGSLAPQPPFQRFKVKIKPEIVTLGRSEVQPHRGVGTYVAPQDWNALIQDPQVVVVDTRNDYEVAIGSFRHARNPQTQHFRQFPAYVQHHLDPQEHPKVALFCTGGIRCEKATALLLHQGFQEVYHLQGGILAYLEAVPPQESLWQGECFVFDGRVALGPGLTQGHHGLCPGCGCPVPLGPQESEPDHCPRCTLS